MCTKQTRNSETGINNLLKNRSQRAGTSRDHGTYTAGRIAFKPASGAVTGRAHYRRIDERDCHPPREPRSYVRCCNTDHHADGYSGERKAPELERNMILLDEDHRECFEEETNEALISRFRNKETTNYIML